MHRIFLGLLMLVWLPACNKEDNTFEAKGILSSSPLDGCSYLIELEDSTRLEAVTNNSGMDLQPNKPFTFRYRIKPAPGISICMTGFKTVEIISLRYL